MFSNAPSAPYVALLAVLGRIGFRSQSLGGAATMRCDLSITNEVIFIVLGAKRFAVKPGGERGNHLANALLAMPELFKNLKQAGVTSVRLTGTTTDGRPLSAAEWLLMLPKSDEELEAARQEALSILPVESDTQVLSVSELASALAEQQQPVTRRSRLV
jgi:undecaprenyl pyrophosphate synthase